MVEASRKHGPFDARWPCLRKDSSDALATAPLLRAAEAAEALDWDAFSNRYFRDRRRHDPEARSAYAAYKQGREWRTTPARLSLVPSDRVSAELDSEEEGTRRLLAAIAARSSEDRDHTYHSDALTLDARARSRHDPPEAMVRMEGVEGAANTASRDVHRELPDIYAEIELIPRRGLGANVRRAVRRARADR